MFLAPVLYGIHALLTGIAMALMQALGVHLGFGFSAGLFDYVLNFSLSTRPWLLLPVGMVYFGLYYGLFRYFILRFDLKTPGRETDEALVVPAGVAGAAPAHAWIQALGSAGNLRAVEACTTRLRLVVNDAARFDEPALKALGSRGVLKLADGAVQVVVGPIADQLASEIRAALKRGAAVVPAASAVPQDPVDVPPADARLLARVLDALGGRGNIADLELRSSRLCISVREPAAVDEAVLMGAVRAVARPAPRSVHLVIGPGAPAWFAGMKLS
jgi:PTS system N-acetylglucosamine-specific IIC component